MDASAPRKPEKESQGETQRAVFLVLSVLPLHNRAFRWRFFITLGLMLTAAMLNAAVPNFFAAAIDQITGDDTSATAWTIAPAVILAAYVSVHWIARMFNEARWMLYGPIEQRAQRHLALKASSHLLRLSLEFHQTRNTGELSRILDNGLRGLREFLFHAVFLMLPFTAEILFVAVIMLIALDPIFCVILVTTLTLYATTLVLGSERLRRHQRQAVTRGAIAHGEAIDALINFETVKHFNNETFVTDRYDRSLADVETLTVRAHTYRSLLGFALMTIIASGMATMLLSANARIEAGTMSIGELVLVNAYLLQLVRPLERFGNLYRQIKQSLVELEQLGQLMSTAPNLPDRANAVDLAPGPGALAFKNVSFAYNEAGPALDRISFEAKPGEKVAFVGPSGAGKSTVAKLLFRFYDPDSGEVLLDDQDIRTLRMDSFRQALAVVPQDPVLFNDTIGYNIAFGRPDATEDEIEAAAMRAQIHDFIASLPKGYKTRVGERGLKLSGGEKQRVAVARAFLKQARVLILDEATSALDSSTERALQTCLAETAGKITTVVVAHRLSTIVDADQILVMQAGQIVERGRHADLLASGGLYAELWERQAQHPDEVGGADISQEPGGHAQTTA